MSLVSPAHTGFRPIALTVAALAITGGAAVTAHTVFAATPARTPTPAVVTPSDTGFDCYTSGITQHVC